MSTWSKWLTAVGLAAEYGRLARQARSEGDPIAAELLEVEAWRMQQDASALRAKVWPKGVDR